jgi:ribosomal protein L11 methylase PrmA
VGVLIANLYADLLLVVADDPRLDAVLPHGILLVSGIAQTKRPLVEAALSRRGFMLEDAREEAWWCALRFTR